ncbi:PREDICTED: uncharacterized protein LOC105564135 isoform X2 [Vollenhovia emeryi]|uniref:uncharacterized protein LOC105564135 isoform X2 n=1 Tax=Vollenhovia emeryi TaxID=411798 RepID=UPI0005F541E7|nr:PREDICTED: uncharacterized protein LOC105564135 isoform X2 [Vollenhovia emeryi]
MLENFQREYNVNRVYLSIIGFWPFQTKFVRNFLQTFCFLLNMSYIFFEITMLHDYWNNPQIIFDCILQMAVSLGMVGRQANEFWNRDKVRFYYSVLHSLFLLSYVYCGITLFRPNMLNCFHVCCDQLRWLYQAIDEHWNIFTDDVEVRIMKDYSMVSRKFVKYYSKVMCSIIVILILIPLIPLLLDIVMPLNEPRPRSFAVEINEIRMNKEDHFLLIFCYTSAIIVVVTLTVLGLDAMHVACTAHACSLFAAVSKQIENITSKANNKYINEIGECKYGMYMKLDPLNEEIIYREYILCLKKHQLAIEFVNILDSSYQGIALLLLMLLLIIISVIAVRIVYMLNQVEEVVKYIGIFLAGLIALMIVSYSGQRLMDESQSIFRQAYAAEWYMFSPRLKSLLIITLYRSNRPCGLKAGNMIPLSIATYAAVIRTAISYFTAFTSIKG